MLFIKGEIRLAIVDDDIEFSKEIKTTLEAGGFSVSTFSDAPEFIDYIREHGLPHLALVDLKLPSEHGFQLSKTLKTWGDLPIIFISADHSAKSVVTGISHYADDYIMKPVNLEVLLARVKRLLNRVYGFENQQITQVDARLSIDFYNNRAYIDGRTIILTPIETRLMILFVRNMGQTVPSETLKAHGWPSQIVSDETFRVQMHRLRRKLEPKDKSSYIQTVRGIGYCFMSDDV